MLELVNVSKKFGQTLVLEPQVLLLDEPMAALDPMIRFDLQEDLRRIFKTLKKTVVLVTHDMAEAGFFGDHVILLGTLARQFVLRFQVGGYRGC